MKTAWEWTADGCRHSCGNDDLLKELFILPHILYCTLQTVLSCYRDSIQNSTHCHHVDKSMKIYNYPLIFYESKNLFLYSPTMTLTITSIIKHTWKVSLQLCKIHAHVLQCGQYLVCGCSKKIFRLPNFTRSLHHTIIWISLRFTAEKKSE